MSRKIEFSDYFEESQNSMQFLFLNYYGFLYLGFDLWFYIECVGIPLLVPVLLLLVSTS